jgi:hypothetical protein
MTGAHNEIIFNCVRPWLLAPGFTVPGRTEALDKACADFLAANGLGGGLAAAGAQAAPSAASASAAVPQALSWPDLIKRITNVNAPALTAVDFERAAADLGHGVTPKHMIASRKVEAPKGPFDDQGRPTILYERHVFARNTNPKGKFNASHPDLSAVSGYGPGGYGAYSAQYAKLERAYALDPNAALEACSWGAFQVLGENAVGIGYSSVLEMVLSLATGEAAHLETYVRFIKANNLAERLGRCRAGAPASCEAFVKAYNGSGYRAYNYHVKFSDALR